ADQLAHARPDLEGELRRRRPDESVDVADRGLGHMCKRNAGAERGGSEATLQGSCADTGSARVPARRAAVRRPSTIELMLLATVVLWALNLTVTRYILTHGF